MSHSVEIGEEGGSESGLYLDTWEGGGRGTGGSSTCTVVPIEGSIYTSRLSYGTMITIYFVLMLSCPRERWGSQGQSGREMVERQKVSRF